jgi:ubiquinone/menaquinone biosynthesis C-methylase UbiE
VTDRAVVVDAFTEMAATYEQTVDWEIRQLWGIGYREFIQQFLTRIELRGGQRVLDVATGTGVIPMALLGTAEWHGSVVGLDLTPAMLTHAQRNIEGDRAGARATLVCGSGLRLPFANRVFDVAVCALGTHHMQPRELLGEMHRVLRTGGRVLVADVARTDFWRTALGRVFLSGMIAWYGLTKGGARLKAEVDAIDNLLTVDGWQDVMQQVGFAGVRLIQLPARRPWFPSGVLIQAAVE